MFMLGYYKEFKFAQRQIMCQLFVKDNQNKLLGINPMGLTAPRADFFEIIALHPVKHCYVLTQLALVTPGTTLLILLTCRQ